MIPYRRKGDLDFAPVPPAPVGSIEIEQTLEGLADRLVGLDEDSQISSVRKQFLVDKFLHHNAEVMRMAYRCFQRFGPDEVFFRVTGVPDPQVMDRGDPDSNFDITINYDVLNTDPKSQEVKLAQMTQLIQLDRNGRIDVDKLLSVLASSIDPILADSVLTPVEDAQQQVVKDVTDDLTKIYAGIEMPARASGGQIAMQVLEQYGQQPDIQQKLQADEAFAGRLQKYAGQYQFQMQQMENAEIGRIGTTPAQMGEVGTQDMGQY